MMQLEVTIEEGLICSKAKNCCIPCIVLRFGTGEGKSSQKYKYTMMIIKGYNRDNVCMVKCIISYSIIIDMHN